MKAWKRIEPTTMTKVGWRKITTKTFILPNGKTDTFDTMHPDGQAFANVLALTPDHKVVIVRQFRPGPEKILDDIPGGFVDRGEDPEVAARRELLEETGYKAGKVEYLGTYHKDVYMNATWHAFIAYDCILEKERELSEAEEGSEVDLITIEQLIDNAKHDKLQDHGVIVMAYDTLKALQKKEK